MGFVGTPRNLFRNLPTRCLPLAMLCLAIFSLALVSGCGTADFPSADFQGLDALASFQAQASAGRMSPLPVLDKDDTRPLYRIGPHDQITVVVWGRPDLGSQVPATNNSRRNITTVNAYGDITLPFLDHVQVGNMSLSEASGTVAKAYAEQVSDPEVQIEMTAFRSNPVQIEGEVGQPGTVYLSDTVLTLGEALRRVGGPDQRANTRRVILTRNGKTYTLNLWDAEHGLNRDLDIILNTGDRVFFPPSQAEVYYVMGDVERQGTFPLPATGVTLLQGLANAGGLNLESASDHNLLLFRTTASDTTTYEFKFFEAMAHEDVELQSGDRIYVARSRLGNFGDGWRNVVPFLSIITSAYFIDRIVDDTGR